MGNNCKGHGSAVSLVC